MTDKIPFPVETTPRSRKDLLREMERDVLLSPSVPGWIRILRLCQRFSYDGSARFFIDAALWGDAAWMSAQEVRRACKTLRQAGFLVPRGKAHRNQRQLYELRCPVAKAARELLGEKKHDKPDAM